MDRDVSENNKTKRPNRTTLLADLAKVDAGSVSPREDAGRRLFASQVLPKIKDKYNRYIPKESWNKVRGFEKRIISYEDVMYYSLLDFVRLFQKKTEQEPDEQSQKEIDEYEKNRKYVGGVSDNRNRHIYIEFPENEKDLEFLWEDLDEGEQDIYLSAGSNDVDQAKLKYFEALKKGILVHEIFHQFENSDLPIEILECAGRYYMNEILVELGQPKVYFSDRDKARIEFYIQLMDKFGTDTIMSIYFGNTKGIDKKTISDVRNTVTDQMRNQLFPDYEDL